MNCKETNKLFQDGLGGTLPETLDVEFQAHLAHCENCSVEFSFLKNIETVINRQKLKSAPVGFADSVIMTNRNSNRRIASVFMRSWGRIAAALILGTGITGGIFTGNRLYDTDDYTYQAWTNEFVSEMESNDLVLDNLFNMNE